MTSAEMLYFAGLGLAIGRAETSCASHRVAGCCQRRLLLPVPLRPRRRSGSNAAGCGRDARSDSCLEGIEVNRRGGRAGGGRRRTAELAIALLVEFAHRHGGRPGDAGDGVRLDRPGLGHVMTRRARGEGIGESRRLVAAAEGRRARTVDGALRGEDGAKLRCEKEHGPSVQPCQPRASVGPRGSSQHARLLAYCVYVYMYA